ncbi:MAG: PilX N-terminal domain-containing pilus assembly protein [Sedimenticolaceae bacterium]
MIRKAPQISGACQRQRGAVLIVALVILLVLTVLGTAGVQNTVVTERMAGNYRDMAVAFESAEAGLRSGETRLADDALYSALSFGGADGSYEVTDLSQSVDPASASYAISTAASEVSPKANGPSTYYLERLPEIQLPNSSIVQGFQDRAPTLQYYRVTAKGFGVSPVVETVLQSTYLR